ncbi:hypothetical protein [Laceyella putida]|uniref:Uncharacterized protein n=1 Tax=Laceyella putida TaxID=110101 RepID=A0ABW2RI41_9BACL
MRQQTKVLVSSLLVTLVILMGGFFASQWWLVTKPIHTIIGQQAGLHVTEMKVMPTEVRLNLKIEPAYDFMNQYPRLLAELEQVAGYRKLTVTLDNGRLPAVDQAWDELQFALREALATKRYTLIPEALKRVAEKHKLTYDVKMDERFVYMQLGHKGQTWRQVVPLEIDSSNEAEQRY